MTARQHSAAGVAFGRPDRRQGYRVDPDFQIRFRTLLLAFAVLVMVAVAALALGVRFVVANPQALPVGAWVPGVLFGVAVGIVALSFHLADRISHRYCGPIRRITATLETVQQGGRVRPIELRRSDELRELAEAVNATLRSLGALED